MSEASPSTTDKEMSDPASTAQESSELPPSSTEQEAGATSACRAAMIIVDMSVEQVADLSYRKLDIIDAIIDLAKRADFVLIVDSHLWISPGDASSLRNLYPQVGREGTDKARLVPVLRHALYNNRPNGRDGVVFVPKYNYSSFATPSPLEEILRSKGITDVYLTGINTDFCIFATALDAFYAGFNVYVVEEAVSSVCGRVGHREGLKQIAKFNCAEVVSIRKILKRRSWPLMDVSE